MGSVRSGGMAQLNRWRGWRFMTDLRTDHPADLHESEPAAGLPDRDERPPAEPAAALSDGVKLTRLLALVRLTAPQALEAGAGMLALAFAIAPGALDLICVRLRRSE